MVKGFGFWNSYIIFTMLLKDKNIVKQMGRVNQNGSVRVYKRDKYAYYVGSITILQKNYRTSFKYCPEGKQQAEAWLKEMRLTMP